MRSCWPGVRLPRSGMARPPGARGPRGRPPGPRRGRLGQRVAWDPYAGHVDQAVIDSADVVANLSGRRSRTGPGPRRTRGRCATAGPPRPRTLADAIAALLREADVPRAERHRRVRRPRRRGPHRGVPPPPTRRSAGSPSTGRTPHGARRRRRARVCVMRTARRAAQERRRAQADAPAVPRRSRRPDRRRPSSTSPPSRSTTGSAPPPSSRPPTTCKRRLQPHAPERRPRTRSSPRSSVACSTGRR